MEINSTAVYSYGATRSYDDEAIRTHTLCVASGGIGAGLCVYAEKMEGENVATRAARVLKLAEVGEHEKTYVGDVDGDGIADRYVLNLDLEGKGPGEVEFGIGSGEYTTAAPALFRNSAGEALTAGQRVVVTHPYDSSRPTEQIDSFRVFADSRKEVGSSQYLLVSVQILSGGGEIFNIDQCAGR